MERRIIDPWTWQDTFGFVQANAVYGQQRVLVCSGQASIDAENWPLDRRVDIRIKSTLASR